MTVRKILSQTVLTFLLVVFFAGCSARPPAPPTNLRLLAHVNDYKSTGYNDVWGYTAPDGREYALLGVKDGTSIIDITDTESSTEVAFIRSAHSDWKDLKTYQHYAYAVNESAGGIQIIDLSDLPNSAAQVGTYRGIATSHNIYIDESEAMLYVEGTSSEPVIVLSLEDPVAPTRVGSFGIECHDMFVQNGRAYISEGNAGSVGIYDITDPSDATLIGRVDFPLSGYVHNAWATADDTYLISTEETPGKTVKLWDLSNLDDIRISDDYLGPNELAHNAFLKGDLAYISHYESGLRVLDISNKTDIVEIAAFPTRDAWGTFPYFDSGKILISDIKDGLYVVVFD